MTCLIRKSGNTAPGTVTVVLQQDDSTVIIRGVPAEVEIVRYAV